MTRLEKPLRRELLIDGTVFVLTIEPERFRLVLKGHRKGLELVWRDLVTGEAALAVALNASLKPQKFVSPPGMSSATGPAKHRRTASRKPRRTRKR